MRLQVVDLNQGLAQRLGEALGEAHAHHQRPHQSGAAGEGDGVDVVFLDSRLADGGVHHGYDILLVRARGQLGYHAAVLLVYLLARNHVAQQHVVAQHGRRRVVAARFYS